MSLFKFHLCDLLQSPHKSQGRQNSGLDDYTCASTSKPLLLLHFGTLKSRTWVGLAAFSHATAPYSRAYLSQRQPSQIQTQNSTETVNNTGRTSEPAEEGKILREGERKLSSALPATGTRSSIQKERNANTRSSLPPRIAITALKLQLCNHSFQTKGELPV